MIKGKLISLRAVEPRDIEQLRQWRNLPELRGAFREWREISPWMQERYWEGIQGEPSQVHFAVVATEKTTHACTDSLIGYCGLTHIDWIAHSAEFGIYIAPDFQGHRYGSDALLTLMEYGFECMNLNRIWAEVYEFNSAIGLYERLGFSEEGRLRQHHFDMGRYWDSLIVGVLRSEWNEFKSHQAKEVALSHSPHGFDTSLPRKIHRREEEEYGQR